MWFRCTAIHVMWGSARKCVTLQTMLVSSSLSALTNPVFSRLGTRRMRTRSGGVVSHTQPLLSSVHCRVAHPTWYSRARVAVAHMYFKLNRPSTLRANSCSTSFNSSHLAVVVSSLILVATAQCISVCRLIAQISAQTRAQVAHHLTKPRIFGSRLPTRRPSSSCTC